MKYPKGILIPSQQQEVRTLVQKLWIPESRKTTVCIDSYEKGVLQGRFYGADRVVHSFDSLSQFLVMMEDMLEISNTPQADTARRSFSALLQHSVSGLPQRGIRRGEKATFELQILFRQHSSWQGIVLWQDRSREQSFRSVLELILLMDSALRGLEEQSAG